MITTNQHYCKDFNEQGYCKQCGQTSIPALDKLGRWPTDTWFQNRRAYKLKETADELSKMRKV